MTISYQQRLVILLAGLVAVTLVTVISATLWSTEVSVLRNSDRELEVSERVFSQLLELREQQLRQGAGILADDFGFRQAIASADDDTIISALVNHGQRIEAELMTVLSPEGDILVSSHDVDFTAEQMVGRWSERASGILRAEGELFQAVVVPVRAPNVIAYVLFGFAVDSELASELESLTMSHVSFVYAPGNSEQIVITSKNEMMERDLTQFLTHQSTQLSDWQDQFQLNTRWLPMTQFGQSNEADSALYVLLASSLEDAQAPFTLLKRSLWLIAGVTLIAAISIAILLGRQVTQPLRELTRIAARIRSGHYAEPIAIKRTDELGELAQGFNKMQSAIAEREAKISHQLTHDELTRLPNALSLKQAVDAWCSEKKSFTLVLVNCQNFRQLNSMYGPSICDRMLVALSERVAKEMSSQESLYRLQGDEFVLLIEDGESSRDACFVRVLEAFNRGVRLGTVHYALRFNAGRTHAPGDAKDFDGLIRNAQFARASAHRAKQAYGDYREGMELRAMRALAISNALPTAISNNELSLVFQPKVDAKTRHCLGVEALLRWQSEDLGWVGPDEFIPIAEQSDLIHELTQWVCRTALETIAVWRSQGVQTSLSVNFSASDLLESEVIVALHDVITRLGVPSDAFVIEVTENAMIEQSERVSDVLTELRALGFGISIDDYGTGFSSLLQLRSLHATELKVDRSFVMNLEHNPADQTIVQSTIEMAHRLGLSVVAEGVESEAAARLLSDWGCDTLQGYFFSKPRGADEFLTWYQAHEERHKDINL